MYHSIPSFRRDGNTTDRAPSKYVNVGVTKKNWTKNWTKTEERKAEM